MATFSWMDTARAVFGACLPWLRPPTRNTSDNSQQSAARRDELESLLQSAEFSDADMDTDALSLHSRLGQNGGRTRIKKKRGHKNKGSITLFGFDLFGRPLREDHTDGRIIDREPIDSTQRISRISSSTLDSDAAPLPDDAIAELSIQARARQEADEAREARRARRRMRKMEEMLSAQSGQDDGFEGFPGSGPGFTVPTPDDAEFGAFQQAPESDFVRVNGGGSAEMYADADGDIGDFDARSYARTAAPRSDSGGSGSRSHTSASALHIPAHMVPLPPSSHSSGSVSPAPRPKSKRAKNSGKRSTTTASSSASQPHPRSPTDAVYASAPRVAIASPTFEGFPEGDSGAFEVPAQESDMMRPFELKLTGKSVHGDNVDSAASSLGFPSPGLTGGRGFPSPNLARGFPSPGLRGAGSRKKPSTTNKSIKGRGGFLARTGDDA